MMDFSFLAQTNTMFLHGPVEIEKRSILLMVCEFLSKADIQVVYITKSFESLPTLLHKTKLNSEYFGKVQFRYVKNKEGLYKFLIDSYLYVRLNKIKFTIILDGLENYCNMTDYEDITLLNALLIGATPKGIPSDFPRVITILNQTSGCNKIFNTFYSNIWHISHDDENTVCLSRNDQDVIKFNLNNATDNDIKNVLNSPSFL